MMASTDGMHVPTASDQFRSKWRQERLDDTIPGKRRLADACLTPTRLCMALCGLGLAALTVITLLSPAVCITAAGQRADHWLGSHEHSADKPQRIAIVNSFHFCYEVIFGLVFSLGLLKHDLEVFINPLHTQFGVEELLRRFYQGPINSYEDLPAAAQGFDTVVYADWYPVGTPRAGGESKLQRKWMQSAPYAWWPFSKQQLKRNDLQSFCRTASKGRSG